MSSTNAKLHDLLMFSEMCAPKYNTSELSDRVLVFDIMPDGWETASILNSVSTAGSTIKPNHDMSNSVSVTTTSSKRSLKDSEEPHVKRVKANTEITEQQDANSREITAQNEPTNAHQHESGNFTDGEQLAENDSQKLNDEQEESNQDETLPLQKLVFGMKRASPSFTKIQRKEPLRQHKINIHSHWLSIQSTYFRSLLHSSGMKETHDTEIHLKIPESEENAHLLLLQAMYHSEVLNRRTVNELLTVLELADKYDVKFVFKICKLNLLMNATTFKVSTKIMHVIKVKHNMNDVEDLAATLQLVLAKEFSPLDENWETKKFTNLSKPSVEYLLDSNNLIVASENTVFHALMHWMEQNRVEPDSLEETDDLLGIVRFKLVTFDYLYNVIKRHPIASKMPKFNQLFLDGMMYHAAPSEQQKMLVKQPVQRKKSDRKVIMQRYVLREQTLNTYYKKGIQIILGWFWACGYRMNVRLIRKSGYSSYQSQVIICGLNKQSLVPLKVSVESTATTTSWQEITFTSESYTTIYPYKTISSYDFDDSQCTLYVAVAPL